jgi:predicted ABC-type ATPase
MQPPEMFIVAGPPGAGKSSVFSLRAFAARIFNADDRAAELNGGSYRAIPLTIRARANCEFESFVRENIAARQSFALETTLRGSITFEQAKAAKSAGFRVFMVYVALDTFERHLERVTQRALLGGHAASEATLHRIYERSLANLPAALDPNASGIEEIRIFDNSVFGQTPKLALEARQGRVIRLASDLPVWFRTALHWTESDLRNIRSGISGPAGRL